MSSLAIKHQPRLKANLYTNSPLYSSAIIFTNELEDDQQSN
jgi:hypothetical protein